MAKKARSCELCTLDARMFCESDQARLCWDCDEKVHAANFLVAKHTRTALCHVCHSPTPWKASGPMLGRTVSVCCSCVARSGRVGAGSGGNNGVVADEEESAPRRANVQREETDDDGDDEEDSEDDFESSEEDISDCDDDDDENQVVPWTSPPPVSTASTSCSEEEGESVSTSRFRDLPFSSNSNREIGPISSSMVTRSRLMAEEASRPLKYRRVELDRNHSR